MKDREFLIGIHERLEHVHHENTLVGYMHRLRAIIHATPKNTETPNVIVSNSLEDLLVMLKEGSE
jgi:hypothetical protein